MHLSSEYGSVIYRMMYMLAFVAAIAIFIVNGFQAGYPKRTWIWITLCGVVFFVLGNKLLTNTPEQWSQFFRDLQLHDTGKRSLLGGILGLFIGLYLGAKWLRFPYPVLDKLAIALPVGMAITRIGCLFAGCCFGEPTHLPWGLTYDAASIPGHIQLSQGLIQAEAHGTHPVHPVQLYDLISCLFIIVLVWCTRKKWKATGSRFLFMLSGYAFSRFFLEFFRDPATDGYLGGHLFGLKAIQWVLFLAFLVILTLLILRERKREFKTHHSGILPNTIFREWSLFILVALFLLSARKWLEIFELITLLLIFVPASLLLFARTYTRMLNRSLRRIAPFLLAGMFLLTAQTLPDEGEKIVYDEYGFGYMTGIFQDAVSKLVGKEPRQSCSGATYYVDKWAPENHSYYFNTIGFQYSHNQIQNKYRRMKVGFGLNAALENEEVVGGKPVATHFTVGSTVRFNMTGAGLVSWEGSRQGILILLL